MDPGDVMDADDVEHNTGQEENKDMQFEEDSRPSGPGGAGGADDPDAMIGLLTSLNTSTLQTCSRRPESCYRERGLASEQGQAWTC